MKKDKNYESDRSLNAWADLILGRREKMKSNQSDRDFIKKTKKQKEEDEKKEFKGKGKRLTLKGKFQKDESLTVLTEED